MASMTMTSTFLGSSATPISKQVVPTTTTANRRGRTLAIKASMKVVEGEKIEINNINEEGTKGRRDLVFGGAAAAAVVAFGLSKIAMADDSEPARGTPEAKKKYAPVCVTMPTARICRK